MIALLIAVLIFVGWLIGRRGLRIMAVVALVCWLGAAVIEGYQDAEKGAVIE